MVSEQVLQSEMAERLGISRSTLSRDLAVIKAEWRSQVRVQYADALSQEVAALDQLERIIWTTHFKECDDALSLRIDLRAVTALLAIKDRRYRLLGLVGPPKPEIRPLPLLTDEEYEADERAMMTRLKRGD